MALHTFPTEGLQGKGFTANAVNPLISLAGARRSGLPISVPKQVRYQAYSSFLLFFYLFVHPQSHCCPDFCPAKENFTIQNKFAVTCNLFLKGNV
jgi:hypothetical protein